jgi:penicillin G amidase
MTVDQMIEPVIRRGVEWLSRNRLPQVDGPLQVSGLHAGVKVYRDRWGVPHIYAENDHDLFFAQGFVHAQDRFWQMEFQRRMTAGRLSEVAGSAALPVDRWMRIVGVRKVVEREVEIACGKKSKFSMPFAAA